MWAKYEAGDVVRIYKMPRPINVDGIQYPQTIFKDEDKLRELSIYPLELDDFDSRYYKASGINYTLEDNIVKGEHVVASKDISAYKIEMIRTIKSIASNLLESTDWMVIRSLDGGSPLPEDVSTFRTNVRQVSNDKEAEVNELNTIDKIINYENTRYVVTRYIEVTNDEGQQEVTTETSSVTTTMSKLTQGWPADPNEPQDSLLVSIVEA